MVSQRVIQELRADFAPYAASSNVMDVITRKRERGLPQTLNIGALETLGIPSGNVSRTLQALAFLGLMEDDGTTTDLFTRLAQAPDREGAYRELLAEVIRNAYHRVFTIVDPSQDGDVAIHDAFRQFQPEAQRGRMVTFFMGMCEQAGIIEHRARERRSENNQRSRGEQPQRRRRQTAPQRQQRPQADEQPRRTGDEDADYNLIFAVIRQLPVNRQWTSERRRRWIAAVEAAVDLMVETIDEPQIFENGEAH